MSETSMSLLSSLQAQEQSLRLQISNDESYDRSAKWQCPICSWSLIRQNILKPYSRLAVTFQRYGDKNLKTHIWVHRFESMRREIIRNAIATEERCLRRRILEQQFVASSVNLFHLHFSTQLLEKMRSDVLDLAETEKMKIAEKAAEETKEEIVEKLDVIHEKIDFSFHFEQIIRLEIEEHESRLRGLIEHETFELNWNYKFKNSPSSHIPFHVMMNSQISAENYYFKFSKFFQHGVNSDVKSIDQQKKQRGEENDERLKLIQRKKFLAQKWLEDNNNRFFVEGNDEVGLLFDDQEFADQQQNIDQENINQLNFSYCHNFVTLKQQFDKRFSQPFSKTIDSIEERILDFRSLPPQELMLPRGILRYGVNMLMNKEFGVNNETGFIPVHRHISENNNNNNLARSSTPQEKSHERQHHSRHLAHNNHDLLDHSANNLNASSSMIILSAVFNANSPKKGQKQNDNEENDPGDLVTSKTKSVGFFDDFDHDVNDNNQNEQFASAVTPSPTIHDLDHENSKKQNQLLKFTSFGVLRRIDDDDNDGKGNDGDDDHDNELANFGDLDGTLQRQKSNGYLVAMLPQSLNIEEHQKQLADIRRREMAEFNFARAKLKKKIDRFVEAEAWTRKEIDCTEKDRRERALDCFRSGLRQLMVWSGAGDADDENNLMMKFFFDPPQRKYWNDHYFAAWCRNAKEATSILPKKTKMIEKQECQGDGKEIESAKNLAIETTNQKNNNNSRSNSDDDDEFRDNKILHNELPLQEQEIKITQVVAQENHVVDNKNSIRATPRLRVEIIHLTSMETSQRQNIFDLEIMARSRKLMPGQNIKLSATFLPPRQPSPKIQNRHSHHCCHPIENIANDNKHRENEETLNNNNQVRRMIPPSPVFAISAFQRKRSSTFTNKNDDTKKQDEEFIVSLYGDPFAQEIANLQQLLEKTETKRRELVEQLKQNKEARQSVYYQKQMKNLGQAKNKNQRTTSNNWRIPTTNRNDKQNDDDADAVSICDQSAKLQKFTELLQSNKNYHFLPVRPPTTTKGRPNSARN